MGRRFVSRSFIVGFGRDATPGTEFPARNPGRNMRGACGRFDVAVPAGQLDALASTELDTASVRHRRVHELAHQLWKQCLAIPPVCPLLQIGSVNPFHLSITIFLLRIASCGLVWNKYP